MGVLVALNTNSMILVPVAGFSVCPFKAHTEIHVVVFRAKTFPYYWRQINPFFPTVKLSQIYIYIYLFFYIYQKCIIAFFSLTNALIF